MNLIPIDVQCYSGHEADEKPQAFRWAGRRIEVEEIVDQWYQGSNDPEWPIANYFKVHGSDGKEYLLKQDRESNEWELVETGN